MPNQKITYIDNKIIKDKEDKYLNVYVSASDVLKSWKESIYSFEWLKPDGGIKPIETLPDNEQEKRKIIEGDLQSNKALETPILGIGLMENIEIGSGRAVFLTLCDTGEQSIRVHIPKSNEVDFTKFITSK
jgi:hypothetical protein